MSAGLQPVLAPILADAWAMFRRDRDWLGRVAAPFLFFPAFALALLVPLPPVLPDGGGGSDTDALAREWARAATTWAGAYGHWHLLTIAASSFGAAVLYAAYLDRDAGDLRGAIGRAFRILPRFLLAAVLVAIPVQAGLFLWTLPGLYVMGRTLLTGPALLAERPLGAARAIVRAFALSRGSALALMALAAMPLMLELVLGQPFAALARQLRSTDGSPVVLALVAAGSGLAAMLAGLAQVLIAVAAYRRLAR
jgi:hypothetical protein